MLVACGISLSAPVPFGPNWTYCNSIATWFGLGLGVLGLVLDKMAAWWWFIDHLTSVEEDGDSGVAQAASTLARVVMTEQEVSLTIYNSFQLCCKLCPLTSSEAMQCQQKRCLHRLHIIWAHPASRSMGTRHTWGIFWNKMLYYPEKCVPWVLSQNST